MGIYYNHLNREESNKWTWIWLSFIIMYFIVLIFVKDCSSTSIGCSYYDFPFKMILTFLIMLGFLISLFGMHFEQKYNEKMKGN